METKTLQTQKNLTISLLQLNQMESYVELKASLVLAMDRLGMTFKNIENTIDDIVLQFPILTINQFRTAVRNGEISEDVEVFDFSKDTYVNYLSDFLLPFKRSWAGFIK